jgi:hypothetical protein
MGRGGGASRTGEYGDADPAGTFSAKRSGWREGCLQAGAVSALTLRPCQPAINVTAPQPDDRQRHIVRSFIPPQRGSRVRKVRAKRIK